MSSITSLDPLPNRLERLLTVGEIAEQWQLSIDTVRNLFLNEPDVVVIQNRRRGVRVYRTIRIPAAVAQRVYRKLMNKAAA